ncbi:hypothetical protein MMC15_005947 [Xylographa vitiligo]|nr:hypothetical protein [Xylographa vitiligo]
MKLCIQCDFAHGAYDPVIAPEFHSISKAAVAMNANPLKTLRVSRYQIPPHNLIPNTSIQHHPLLIYHSAFPSFASATSIESHLRQMGVVTPQWRYTMYSTTHFHSSSHEVLAISNGRAKLCFGGEENPQSVEPVVEKGDVIVVAAGVGHRLLEDLEGGFEMVGSYPTGKQWDMCYGREAEREKIEAIRDLKWFDRDPVYGHEGPVLNAS